MTQPAPPVLSSDWRAFRSVQKGRKRFKKLFSHVRRIDLLNDLPEEEVDELISCFIRQEYPEGTTLYQKSDPCKYLYIIENWEVEMIERESKMRMFTSLTDRDAFGTMSFLTETYRSR